MIARSKDSSSPKVLEVLCETVGLDGPELGPEPCILPCGIPLSPPEVSGSLREMVASPEPEGSEDASVALSSGELKNWFLTKYTVRVPLLLPVSRTLLGSSWAH